MDEEYGGEGDDSSKYKQRYMFSSGTIFLSDWLQRAILSYIQAHNKLFNHFGYLLFNKRNLFSFIFCIERQSEVGRRRK